MSIFPINELQELVEYRADPCVSLYLPTYRIGADVQQNPIHLKDLLDQAEQKLNERGIRPAAVRDLLLPARELLDRSEFWRNQSDGLVLFIAPDYFREYRLPEKFPDTIQVNTRFFIKPLLPLTGGDGTFYILALSQNKVRLLRGTADCVEEVEVRNIPHSLEEAMVNTTFQEEQGFQTDTQNSGGVGGERPAMFYGHGNKKDAEKTNLLEFFRQVDRGVADILEKDTDPLILAGVGYLFPIYRQASTYNHLYDQGIEGNPDGLDAKELHAQAWKLIKPHFEQARTHDVQRFYDLSRTDMASTDPRQVIPAAFYGRVDTLFVALNHNQWGTFDSNNGAVRLHTGQHNGDEDLSDAAAVQTWLNNGQVYALDPGQMPDGAMMAAIFRYALPNSPGKPVR